MKKIYISPSDQVRNTYAAGNTTEAIQCRAIAQLLVAALKRCGFDAKTNVTDGMYERVAEGNAWKANLYICIHTNAFDGKVTGTRLFCYKFGSTGHNVCKAVMETLAPITPGWSDSISEYPQLYEVRATNAPCCYIEVEFHDNPTTATWIVGHKPEIAEAIAKGICNHFKVKYVARDTDPAASDDTDADETRYNTLADIKSETYRPVVENLVSLGFLRGKGGSGEQTIIDLGEDAIRLFAVLDRAGAFDGDAQNADVDLTALGKIVIADVIQRLANG